MPQNLAQSVFQLTLKPLLDIVEHTIFDLYFVTSLFTLVTFVYSFFAALEDTLQSLAMCLNSFPMEKQVAQTCL